MTWAAAAVLLAVVLVVVAVALRRTIRSLQWVVDDLQREAGPLLAELEGDARKASQVLDRVGDLVGAAESVTRRVDGAAAAGRFAGMPGGRAAVFQ